MAVDCAIIRQMGAAHVPASLWFLIPAASAVLSGAGHSEALAAAQDRCQARLEVKLTPSVPNPRDPAFLSGLAANPLYALTYVGEGEDSVVLDLTGPATDYRCEDEINRISRDAHVLDLKVLQSTPDK